MVAFNKVNAERLAAANALAETKRANLAKERLTSQQNVEARRANLAREGLTSQQNVEAKRANLAREALQSAVNMETARSNRAREAEMQRSNLASEDINRQRNVLTYDASRYATDAQSANTRYVADKSAAMQKYTAELGKAISDNQIAEAKERRLDEYRQRNWTLDLEGRRLDQDQDKIDLAREQFDNNKWLNDQTVKQKNRELDLKTWSTLSTGIRDLTQSYKNVIEGTTEIPKTLGHVVSGFIPG